MYKFHHLLPKWRDVKVWSYAIGGFHWFTTTVFTCGHDARHTNSNQLQKLKHHFNTFATWYEHVTCDHGFCIYTWHWRAFLSSQFHLHCDWVSIKKSDWIPVEEKQCHFMGSTYFSSTCWDSRRRQSQVIYQLVGWIFRIAGGMALRITLSVHHFDPDWNTSTTTGWIVVKLCSDNYCLQRMKHTDFFYSTTMRLTCLIFSEMFRQLLDGLPWNLAQVIHGLQRIYPNDFGGILTFPFVAPAGWRSWFWLKCLDRWKMACHKIWSRWIHILLSAIIRSRF